MTVQETASGRGQPDGEKIRVLLVEDNPGDAKLILRMFEAAPEKERFAAQHVESLAAGVELMKSKPIDVMLLDLGLPGSTGLETASKAIAAAPDTAIIALTGTETPQVVLETIKAGVGDYFVKSRIEPKLLIEAILRQHARRRQLTREASPSARAQPRTAERKNRKPIDVLVVEDNPGDLILIRRMLTSGDRGRFEVHHASTLSSALLQLRNATDVVLLDLNLPDSEDLDTLRRMREEHASIPILILTGLEDRRKAVEALANGAQDYLVKGKVDSQLLAKAILRQLGAKDAKPVAR